jgi:adenine-specific DNA-methyltransferase
VKPYYEADGVTLFHADALAFLRSLPDASVHLVATDPPYFRVKDEEWDRAWKDEAAFLAWIGTLCDEFRRILTPNGSLYLFASPQMAHGVEREVRQRLSVLNVIRWYKDAGWHQKAEKEALRSYLEPWEACVFAEHITADTMAADASGYYTATTMLHRRVYRPLGDYFRRVRESSGFDGSLSVALGYSSALYDRWEEGAALPTRDAYERLRGIVGLEAAPKEYDELRRWYDVDLRREYEHLRREYEHLRRPLDLGGVRESSDRWTFSPVMPYPGKHPCEKPLAMMEHIVRASSRPGDVVLDPFCGSGATIEAARNLNRKCIAGDADLRWVEWTARRLSQQTFDFSGVA